MRKLVHKAVGRFKELYYLRKIKDVPETFLIKNVPYFSQWESPELVEPFLTHSLDTSKDPNWKKSGAKTKQEYVSWSANACGMACTKMILAKEISEDIPIVTLGTTSVKYGVYILPLETSVGLIYKPFAKFMKAEFNIDATLVLPLTRNQIIYELSQGNYVIASVSPQIRHTDAVPSTKGGHLVLLLGYDLHMNVFYFHNPSGFTKETQEYATISFKDFMKFFGKRGIVIKGLNLIH